MSDHNTITDPAIRRLNRARFERRKAIRPHWGQTVEYPKVRQGRGRNAMKAARKASGLSCRAFEREQHRREREALRLKP